MKATMVIRHSQEKIIMYCNINNVNVGLSEGKENKSKIPVTIYQHGTHLFCGYSLVLITSVHLIIL